MPVKQMKEFLDKYGVQYVSIDHSMAYTAQETAASAHIHGRELAKTVIVKIDGKMAMAVLPASCTVSMDLLQKAIGAGKVEIAAENEFMDRFPGCVIGAMPPFGNLYGMEVFVAEDLSQNEDIAFNAGSHTELIKLKYKDFARMVQPRLLKFSFKPGKVTSK